MKTYAIQLTRAQVKAMLEADKIAEEQIDGETDPERNPAARLWQAVRKAVAPAIRQAGEIAARNPVDRSLLTETVLRTGFFPGK
jgi:hypothetical protein